MKIILAMKSIKNNFADNVILNSVAGLNIDACRLEGNPEPTRFDPSKHSHEGWRMNATGKECANLAKTKQGRFPANIILCHKNQCKTKGFKQSKGRKGGYSYENNEYKVEGFVKSCKPKAPSNYGGENIKIWNCELDCPVYNINKQSDVTKKFTDSASRFFKQIKD